MERIEHLRQALINIRPVLWDDLPDFELYMDQVLGYMQRQLIPLGDGAHLTSSMVNNYIKEDMMPRARGKKYDKEHLARLTAICLLKPVLSAKDIQLLLSRTPAGKEEAAYEQLGQVLNKALLNTEELLPKPDDPDHDLYTLAMRLAIESYSNKLACESILSIIREKDPKAKEMSK